MSAKKVPLDGGGGGGGGAPTLNGKSLLFFFIFHSFPNGEDDVDQQAYLHQGGEGLQDGFENDLKT